MIRKTNIFVFVTILALCFIVVDDTSAGRRQKQVRGEIFQVAKPFNETFDTALNFLQRKGYIFEPATRRDIGQITTTLLSARLGMTQGVAVKVEIIFIKDNEKETTLEVILRAWLAQKGKPWVKQSRVHPKQQEFAQEIKALFGIETDVPKGIQ